MKQPQRCQWVATVMDGRVSTLGLTRGKQAANSGSVCSTGRSRARTCTCSGGQFEGSDFLFQALSGSIDGAVGPLSLGRECQCGGNRLGKLVSCGSWTGSDQELQESCCKLGGERKKRSSQFLKAAASGCLEHLHKNTPINAAGRPPTRSLGSLQKHVCYGNRSASDFGPAQRWAWPGRRSPLVHSHARCGTSKPEEQVVFRVCQQQQAADAWAEAVGEGGG